MGEEKLKLTIKAKPYGYTGYELYDILRSHGIVCELCDPDYVVMMLTIENTSKDLKLIRSVLISLPPKMPISDTPPHIFPSERALSPKNAYFSPRKSISIDEAIGKTLALSSVACPPAINIIVAGEKITKASIDACKYYGINRLTVVDD